MSRFGFAQAHSRCLVVAGVVVRIRGSVQEGDDDAHDFIGEIEENHSCNGAEEFK